MKWSSLVIPFTFVAGVAAGVCGKSVYDDLAAPAPIRVGEQIKGVVARVYDGDTLTLKVYGNPYPVRIWGIDAPELAQKCGKGSAIIACGKESRIQLQELILNKAVSCTVKSLDKKYNRLVGQCFAAGADPVATLVREGWAFSDTVYSADPYGAEQGEARARKDGLWGMTSISPERWRACKALRSGGSGAIPADCFNPLGPIKP